MNGAAVAMLERLFGRGGIVAYHGVGEAPASRVLHVTPARLEEQLALLAARYDVLPLRELVARWKAGRSTDGCVAITFDDAYAGVLRHAVPRLVAAALPATVFVAWDAATRGEGYWWDELDEARRDAPDKAAAWAASIGLPAGVAPDRMRDHLLAVHAGAAPWERVPRDPSSDWRSLTLDEIDGLLRLPGMDVGCHTMSHPALPFLAAAKQRAQIEESWTALRARFEGRAVPILAYPFGLYDSTTVRAAREAGMVAGVTMSGAGAGRLAAAYEIPRIMLGDVHEATSITKRLTYAWRPVTILRERGRRPRLPRPSWGVPHV